MYMPYAVIQLIAALILTIAALVFMAILHKIKRDTPLKANYNALITDTEYDVVALDYGFFSLYLTLKFMGKMEIRVKVSSDNAYRIYEVGTRVVKKVEGGPGLFRLEGLFNVEVFKEHPGKSLREIMFAEHPVPLESPFNTQPLLGS